MSVIVEIPALLAMKVEAVAKSHATSPEQYVIEAVTKTVAQDASNLASDDGDPVLGSFAEDAELMDSIVEQAMIQRRTASEIDMVSGAVSIRATGLISACR